MRGVVPSLSAGSHYIAQACPQWQASCLILPNARIKSIYCHNGVSTVLVYPNFKDTEQSPACLAPSSGSSVQLSPATGVASRHITRSVLLDWHSLATDKRRVFFSCVDVCLGFISCTVPLRMEVGETDQAVGNVPTVASGSVLRSESFRLLTPPP